MATLSTKTSSSSALSSIFYPTKEDLRLYKNMTLALGAPPNSHMFRFMGAAGQHLVFIGESGTQEWSRVQKTAAGRWPHLPVSEPVADDGTKLDSLPERIVYQMLSTLKRRNMHVDVHEPICISDGRFRADLTLRKGNVSRYIEVAGCCGSDRITRNEEERRWLARLDQRLSFYRALDITPVVVWLDMFARPAELQDLCIDLVDDVALRGGGPDHDNSIKEEMTILPRWSEGTIRVLDIAPIGLGQPQLREGLPISVVYRDLVMRPDQTFADVNGGVFQGRVQEVPGERGGSDFVVEDRLFNAVFPHDQMLPLCLAGYNVSFLHRLLGAPWGERPHQLCLHRLARIYNLGKSSDYSLAEIVEYLQPSFEVPWFECEAFTRMMQSRVVLRHLLTESRLNMLAALSVARTPPPPTSEPFGKAVGWQAMEDRVYRDFE